MYIYIPVLIMNFHASIAMYMVIFCILISFAIIGALAYLQVCSHSLLIS